MMHLQSPQYSNSSKADLFSKQRSPSTRNKRIPSASDNYICSSNQNLKINKHQSPSKVSEEMKRRKSHHMQNSTNSNNSANKRKLKVQHDAQDIMSSIQILKQQYKNLKEAYKDLIIEKMNNVQQINQCKHQNVKLKSELQEIKIKKIHDEEEISLLKMEIVRLTQKLQIQQKKRKQMENDLYFMPEKPLHFDTKDHDQKMHSELSQQNKFINTERIHIWKNASQKRLDLDQICSKTISNDSKMMSFSLSSIIEESIVHQKQSKRRQHIKVSSDLSHVNLQTFDKSEVNKKKDDSNFKKSKKQSMKQGNTIENRQCKVLSNIINPLSQLLYSKSPVNSDKKIFKNQNSSNSKKKKIEDKQNIEMKINKKKPKKPLQIISNES